MRRGQLIEVRGYDGLREVVSVDMEVLWHKIPGTRGRRFPIARVGDCSLPQNAVCPETTHLNHMKEW